MLKQTDMWSSCSKVLLDKRKM